MIFQIIDYIFKAAFIFACIILILYFYYGWCLANLIRKLDPSMWVSLGRPRGLYNFLMKETLFTKYVSNKEFVKSNDAEIKSMGRRVLFVRSRFRDLSLVCMVCLILISFK